MSTPYFVFITSLIFVSTKPFAASLKFSITSFSPNDNNTNYGRDAFVSDYAIHLINESTGQMEFNLGRATYKKPMHLWDKDSRNLTDFTTHFTFVIDSQGSTRYGDGLAFFLAPSGSTVPGKELAHEGYALGLTNDGQQLDTTVNQFVAVEFDTWYNSQWDPENSIEHVGIDINSVKSVANVSWLNCSSSIMQGLKNEVWISYDSTSTNLSVVFHTSLSGTNTTLNQNLHYKVDLRDYLPYYVTLGFSSATGIAYARHQIHSWEFNSTLETDEDAVQTDPGVHSPSTNNTTKTDPGVQSPISLKNNTIQTDPGVEGPRPSTSKKNTGLVIGLIVGGLVFVCACGMGLFATWKKKNRVDNEDDILVDDDDMDIEFGNGIGPKKFPYDALAEATNNFSEEDKLGEGGFGGVYRGFLKESNSYVAVKRVSRGSSQGIKEYASEVKIISRLRHKNLVQLIGWCHVQENLLLVYDFMPNGSLDAHLFKGQSLLSWGLRFKIAQGLASVLLYLHEEWDQCVLHRDIKSSNVMLDSNFNTKLGDFGLARLVDHDKGAQTTILAGTRGYMAPECFITGQASRESDVFSFGVVALEIACGRKPINTNLEENQIELVKWVWDLYGMDQIVEAADPKLDGDYDEEEIERLMIVGLWCAHPDSTIRPTIRQAIHVLKFDVPLPNLPPKMPLFNLPVF